MTKPANFPERKRQRQISALARLAPMTKGKPGRDPQPNGLAIAALKAAIAEGSQREVRTKKDRSARGRFHRAS
jgi:hypothetical protein